MSLLSKLFDAIWDHILQRCDGASYVATMIVEFLALVAHPRTWSHPVRQRLARQILFSGFEAIPFTLRFAAIIGISILLQCIAWRDFTGDMSFLSGILPIIVVREGAPFLASFIIIGASASSMTCELANMKTNGEIDLLESQGINVFRLIAFPRMLGLAISALGLSILFSFVAFAAIAAGMFLFLIGGDNVGLLLHGILRSLSLQDLVNLVGKSMLVGLLTGAICCARGLSASGPTTVVPQAVNRAMMKSILVLSIVSTIFSLFNYG